MERAHRQARDRFINWQRRRRFIHQRAVLDRLTADLKAQGPDHIAVTGDIANIALSEEYRSGRAWLDSLGSPQNVSFVPGNHDAYVREGLKLPNRPGDRSCAETTAARAFPICGGAPRWR